MKPLKTSVGLTEQTYQALLDEITAGRLLPGAHLVQEQLAAQLGISRQPVQQALAMLKADGLVLELGRRGLFVAPLDMTAMSQRYQIREALDGLAARLAAERVAGSKAVAADVERDCAKHMAAGRAAAANGKIAAMVDADIAFHGFIYTASGNPHLEPTAAIHWRQLRRVMGEVLRIAGAPDGIWQQHQEIADAICAGDAGAAERLAVSHVRTAAERLRAALVDTGGNGGRHDRSTTDAPRTAARASGR